MKSINQKENIIENQDKLIEAIIETNRQALYDTTRSYKISLCDDGTVLRQIFPAGQEKHEPVPDAVDVFTVCYHKWDLVSAMEKLHRFFYNVGGTPAFEQSGMLDDLILDCHARAMRSHRGEDYEDGELLLGELSELPSVERAFYYLIDFVHNETLQNYLVTQAHNQNTKR